MARDTLNKENLPRYEIRKKFKLRDRVPDRLKKYEIPQLGKTRTEIAEYNEEKMYQYLRWDLRRIIDDVDVGDLVDLVEEVRNALKDEDVRAALHNQKRRYEYNSAKAENRARAQRAYWKFRKIGRKESKAVEAEQMILAGFRKERGK